MHGEQADVLVHPLVHVAVELGEGREVGADLVLLVSRLLEQTLRHYKAHVLPGEKNLGEALVHAAQTVGHMLEAAAVEDGFLHAGHEAETQVLGDLADLAQEGQIQH